MAKNRPAAKPVIPFSRQRLYSQDIRCYSGEGLNMISFPLGGIGTGTIGLGGRGELRDWEIFNKPNKGFRPQYTMPYIFCRQGDKKVAKVLERKLLPPLHDSQGLPPRVMPGLPRLDEAVFVGTYPMARIFFHDADLPVSVQLEAFNPMIPGNADDSGIPVAILAYTITNETRKPVSGSIALSMANSVGMGCCCDAKLGGNVNAFKDAGSFRGIYMTSRKYDKDQAPYGTMALATTAKKVTYATEFNEPGWWDAGQKVWDEYSATGRLAGPKATTKPSGENDTRVGMLCAEYNLKAGASEEILFLITWSFPQRQADWGTVPQEDRKAVIPNHYARRFGDAWKTARYVVDNLKRLRKATLNFERAMFDSSLPGAVIDAVSSQMSVIRTNTTMWLDDPADDKAGRIFAFEGCCSTFGCCPMNCTHVWNYEQSMAHLYPSLERSMRKTDYLDNINRQGAMSFRTSQPLRKGRKPWKPDMPAADGQFGTVVKTYREWRISGDDAFLKKLWPAVRESIRFAWQGFAGWDADKDGVMEGVQHNTYDIEFHGPNTMCGSLYLAALKAGIEMAEHLGDRKAAAEFAEVLRSGSEKYDRMLFNGEYYEQKVIYDKKKQKKYPKYQYGCGCLSDQLLGQWAAHVAGLGYVLPEKHVSKAMAAIFRNNFKPNLSNHHCCQRVYAVGDEGGLVNCSWPNGGREKFPFVYSDEVWTGIEYQVAAGLIYEGLVDEGLSVVTALRDRHDGVARNPWNEFECGDHYARAMASWSVLLALSGQRYDGRVGRLTVRPLIEPADFKCIYTANDAYGTYHQQFAKGRLSVTVTAEAGVVKLGELAVARPGGGGKTPLVSAKLNGKAVAATVSTEPAGLVVKLAQPLALKQGRVLTIKMK